MHAGTSRCDVLGIEPSTGCIIRPGVTAEEDQSRRQFWEGEIDKLWLESPARNRNCSDRAEDGVWGTAVDSLIMPIVATHQKVRAFATTCTFGRIYFCSFSLFYFCIILIILY